MQQYSRSTTLLACRPPLKQTKTKKTFLDTIDYVYFHFLHLHPDEKNIYISLSEIWSFSLWACTNFLDPMPSKHPPTNFHWHLQTTLILNVRRIQPQLSVPLCLGWDRESETRSNFKALFFFSDFPFDVLWLLCLDCQWLIEFAEVTVSWC